MTPAVCRVCGVLLTKDNRHYCESYWREYEQEQVATFSTGERTKLAELRAASTDPAHGEEAARKRGKKIRERSRERTAWEARHEELANPEVFQSSKKYASVQWQRQPGCRSAIALRFGVG